LDEIAGYENIIRDSKMGIKLPNRVPDIIPPIRDRSKKEDTTVAASAIGSSHNSSNSVVCSVAKELKTPDLIRPFATQMSDALSHTAKSASFPDDLGAVAFPDSDSTNDSFVRSKIPPPPIASEEALSSANIQTVGIIDISTMEEQVQPLENVVSTACSSLSIPEHHHKSEKKKRKKEHKEHKHKDKDKNREEKKHKHKHRDKDKDRHKKDKAEGSAPIKITIPKDKINLSSPLEPVAGTGLKLKLKNYMFKSTVHTDSTQQPALSKNIKIKIGDEVVSNFSNSSVGPPALSTEAPSSSRKRDHSSPRSSELVTPPGPPAKSARLNTSSGEQRRSGNNCSNYGKQNGVEHHRRGSHYSTLGGKVRGVRGVPRGNCYMTPAVPIQQPQPYQPYPHYYQAYPPPPGIVPQPYMYGYYPPAAYMYQPPLPTGPAPDVGHHQEPPPLPEGPPPDDNPPPPPPPE
jgi:cyclin T